MPGVKKIKRNEVLNGLREIAFGKANDIVKLAILNDENFAELGGLDLLLLSEVKKNTNGTLEVKLINRLQAIEILLREISGETGKGKGPESFFKAMENAAGYGKDAE